MELFFISSVFIYFFSQWQIYRRIHAKCWCGIVLIIVTTPGNRGSFLQPPPGVLKAVRQEEIFY